MYTKMQEIMGVRRDFRGVQKLPWEQEAVGSNPAAPTVFRNKPFGASVEGLSH
jgi:hypothetical protein